MPAAEQAAPSRKRPASETLHNRRHSRNEKGGHLRQPHCTSSSLSTIACRHSPIWPSAPSGTRSYCGGPDEGLDGHAQFSRHSTAARLGSRL